MIGLGLYSSIDNIFNEAKYKIRKIFREQLIMGKESEEKVEVSKDNLNQLLDDLESIQLRLNEVHRRQRELMEHVLNNGTIKPGALFEVMDNCKPLLQEDRLDKTKDHVKLQKGDTIMFVRMEDREGIPMYDWIVDERVVAIHPGNFANHIGLVRNGSDDFTPPE